MKKFISMVMAAAMVVSLVPATAFAKGEVTASAKIVDAIEETKDFDGNVDGKGEDVPELQMKIKDVDYQKTNDGKAPEMDVTLTLDNASFDVEKGWTEEDLKKFVGIRYDDADISGDANASVAEAEKKVTAAEEALAEAQEKAEAPAAVKGKLQAAKADLTDAKTAKTTADEALAKAKETAATSAAAAEAAETAYYEAVAEGAADVADKKTAMETAQAQAATDAEAVTTAQEAADKAAEAVTAAEAAVEEAQAAYDEAVANDADVVAAKEALAKAEKALEDAKNSAAVSNVTFENFKLNSGKDELEFTIVGELHAGDIVYVDLFSVMDKVSEGKKATVSVESKMVSADDLVYVSILGHGITASTKGVANIAEEEKIEMKKDLKIKSNVGDFVTGQVFELKLSKGFEFDFANKNDEAGYKFSKIDDNVVYMEYTGAGTDEITIAAKDISVEATSAKAGDTCTLTVKALKDRDINNDRETVKGSFSATTSVELMKVVDYKVVLSVDEDEDIPVIYSGVNVDNYGITDDSDHLSLEVTAEETFPGAWSMRKGFNFELPEGVYVTNVDVTEAEYFYINGDKDDYVGPEEVEAAFWNAYQDGSHVNFEFEKRVFDDVDSDLRDKKCATMTFQLELVADPTFEGDVVLKLNGDLVDEQEVTIAKFVKPYTVKAEQNDLIIDYRYTDIPTAITITEAEAGLWAKDEATFNFTIEKSGLIAFEDDATFEVDKDSEMELKGKDTKDGRIEFTVKSESDEAATVTIKDMQLFMQRNIPAGPYDLSIGSSLADAYEREVLFAPDAMPSLKVEKGAEAPDRDDYADDYAKEWKSGDRPKTSAVDEDTYVTDVCDYSDTVKEAFVNVVTAGRDQDDASFTTKVVVPVGEAYLISGETQVALDVPAYINAAGYTMLPVRAVATALGILNNNVLWDGATKTVTILYGQRIITMVAGQKVVYVNGSAIPASASVEIVNGRTFLPMRDLATALGVTDITWDAATKTATLNGNQK